MAAPGFDLDAYLERIGLQATAAATLDGLTSLHEAHCAAVPFENLDILLGRPIRLDIPSLQAKLVAGRRGGYCFEQNTLFQAALQEAGFTVTPLLARVRAGASSIRPRTHMLLRVDLAGRAYLADVGFGGDGPVRPLPLEAGAVLRHGPFMHRLVREADAWLLQRETPAGWSDLYAFTLEPQHPVDFELANYYTSTHPESRFVVNLVVQRSWSHRRLVLLNRDLAQHTPTAQPLATLRDPDHLLAVLADDFGLRFPPGTRFAQPPF